MEKLKAVLEPNVGWVETHTLEHCGHQIFPKSREADRVMHLIAAFFQRL
jgi:hypothetical protein